MNLFYFTGANELRLKAIVTSGGPQKLCQLWHTDVYEVRQNIMRTFRHLLGKYFPLFFNQSDNKQTNTFPKATRKQELPNLCWDAEKILSFCQHHNKGSALFVLLGL